MIKTMGRKKKKGLATRLGIDFELEHGQTRDVVCSTINIILLYYQTQATEGPQQGLSGMEKEHPI